MSFIQYQHSRNEKSIDYAFNLRENKINTFCEYDVSAAFEDDVAKGFTNVLPSTIAFGLSSSTSCE
nr:hypothetical protein [Tanacetum cinerariifolium]